mmetsp:Transcript_115589/g.288850  ORF Transcript_115589/g.288850 Transcript_115589/m.288850 type:complete len:310 (+) Transcript_115589:304-1233(+)
MGSAHLGILPNVSGPGTCHSDIEAHSMPFAHLRCYSVPVDSHPQVHCQALQSRRLPYVSERLTQTASDHCDPAKLRGVVQEGLGGHCCANPTQIAGLHVQPICQRSGVANGRLQCTCNVRVGSRATLKVAFQLRPPAIPVHKLPPQAAYKQQRANPWLHRLPHPSCEVEVVADQSPICTASLTDGRLGWFRLLDRSCMGSGGIRYPEEAGHTSPSLLGHHVLICTHRSSELIAGTTRAHLVQKRKHCWRLQRRVRHFVANCERKQQLHRMVDAICCGERLIPHGQLVAQLLCTAPCIRPPKSTRRIANP